MSVSHQTTELGVTIVNVGGRLDQQLTLQLESELAELLDQNYSRLVVDMIDVSYINSGGLRTLVTAWRTARKQDGNLVLCSLSPRVSEIFDMVGFTEVFQIYDDRRQAEAAIIS